MNKNTLYTRHKKFFLVMGIIESCSILIMMISLLLLPIASYNLTKLDFTKVTFNFFELIETNPLIVIGFFLLCSSFVPNFISKMFIQKDIWKDKIKTMMLLTFVGVAMFIIGAVIFNFSIMEYTEPNTGDIIILKMEIGLCLFWVGLLSIAINFYEIVCLKLIFDGKCTEEQMFGSFSIEIKPVKDYDIEDKMKQLLSLKQAGAIAEDEFNQKKKELLDKLIK